ncbi:hypothetical protein [Anaeropeptidivorans aminofermentans]|uniref:hypothetical protein n=1 Tax=Anaeropeptidivorans aminofermentans TaxID=2934315 RepID=UPI002023D26E|nr:hypothetical protein [Anaeropeptidivorans aminofermentans]
MSENNMFEIGKFAKGGLMPQDDINEAMALVVNMFKEKYISKFQKEIEDRKKKVMTKPSKEMKLLQSLKDFMPEEKKKNAESMIEMLSLMEAISEMQNEATLLKESNGMKLSDLNKYNLENVDNSIHTDGIYEIDRECLLSRQKRPFGPFPSIIWALALSKMSGEFKEEHRQQI